MRLMVLLIWLLLLFVHVPAQAQALVRSFLPDFLPIATSEPTTLIVTGVALLSLAQIGARRSR